MTDWVKKSSENPAYTGLCFLRKLERGCNGRDFTGVFSEALQTCRAEDGFSAGDIQELLGLAEHLGKSDTATQLQYVEQCMETLSESQQEVKAETVRTDRLYVTLGISGGLAVAILLL